MRSGLGAVLLFASATTPLQAAGSVVINELMWDGTEYIELYNTSADPVTLEGWTLTRQQTGGEAKIITTFDAADSITAGGYFLIEKTADSTTQDAQKVVSGLTLVNTGELVMLRDAEGALIDAANQVGAWFAGENTDQGTSMERADALRAGTEAASWHTATEEHFGRIGSPGIANSTPPVNTPPEAVVAGSSAGLAGTVLAFSAEDSRDEDDDTLTYAWQFGDNQSAAGMEVSHSYAKAGAYVVILTVADDETEDTVTHELTITTPVYTNDVVLNEVLPNPTGADTTGEFIELYNTGASSIDLSGWQLDDAEGGSAPYTLPAGSTITAHGYAVYFRSDTKLALNNDEDTVRLLDPAKTVRSELTYKDNVPEGQSYNRTDTAQAAVSTTLTPGAKNIITIPEDEDETEEEEERAATSGRVAGTSVTQVALADVREEEVGVSVQTEGVISVPPGVLNPRWFYLAGSGVQTYLYSAAFPDLKLGDTVRITGQLTTYQNEARVKVAQASDIQKISAGPPPTPHQVATGDIGEDWEGALVVVQGEVVETSGDTFYVDDGSGEIRAFINAGTKIDKPKMKKGMALTVTGIVSETRSGYRLLPRFQEDIRMGLVAGLTSFPATGRGYLFIVVCGVLVVILLQQGYIEREPLLQRL